MVALTCCMPPLQQGGDRSGESLFFPTQQSLAYLDGSYAGDFGFDPLGLSDPEGAGGFINPEWLRYGEARPALLMRSCSIVVWFDCRYGEGDWRRQCRAWFRCGCACGQLRLHGACCVECCAEICLQHQHVQCARPRAS